MLQTIAKSLRGLTRQLPKRLSGVLLKVAGLKTQNLCDMSKKDYFPNNWQQFKDADDELFVPHTFEEVMSWKVAGWELPSSVCCLIRVTDVNTKQIVEYTYQKPGAARNKISQLMSTPNIEFVVCDHESIHYLSPADV